MKVKAPEWETAVVKIVQVNSMTDVKHKLTLKQKQTPSLILNKHINKFFKIYNNRVIFCAVYGGYNMLLCLIKPVSVDNARAAKQ